jgi:hypothetical protein
MRYALFLAFVVPVALLIAVRPGRWEDAYRQWLDKHERVHHLLTWLFEWWFMLMLFFIAVQAALVLYRGIVELTDVMGGWFVLVEAVVGFALYLRLQTDWGRPRETARCPACGQMVRR